MLTAFGEADKSRTQSRQEFNATQPEATPGTGKEVHNMQHTLAHFASTPSDTVSATSTGDRPGPWEGVGTWEVRPSGAYHPAACLGHLGMAEVRHARRGELHRVGEGVVRAVGHRERSLLELFALRPVAS